MAETKSVFHVVSIDPGGVSGWALFVVHKRALLPQRKIVSSIVRWEAGEFEGEEESQVDEMLSLVQRARFDPFPYVSGVYAMTERWTPLALVEEDALSPVRLNAMFGYGLRTRFGLPLAYQEQSARATPEQLKRWGFNVRGKDAKSAVGHGLTFLRRLKKAGVTGDWWKTDLRLEAARG